MKNQKKSTIERKESIVKAAVRQILGMKSSEHTVHKVNADISLKESEIRFFQRMSDKQKEEDKENA